MPLSDKMLIFIDTFLMKIIYTTRTKMKRMERRFSVRWIRKVVKLIFKEKGSGTYGRKTVNTIALVNNVLKYGITLARIGYI